MLTHEHIRAGKGIVHSDGNIFFTNIAMLNAVVESAATAPLLARIAELEAANEAFGKRQEWWNARMLELEQQLDVMAQNTETQAHASLQREIELTEKVEKLTRELEEARKDAERYRLLRYACCEGYPSGEGSSRKDAYLVITGYDDLYPMTDAQKDAAIDAAFKEQT